MRKLILAAAVLMAVGCGGGAPGTQSQEAAASAPGSGIVGSWSLLSDDGVTPQPSWHDTMTFGADGSWSRVVGSDSYAGTWSATDVAVTFDGATVGYRLSACGQSSCLDLAYAGGSTWIRR